ncbi:hypothetical protein ACGFIF_43200, partial [Kribbella sp. NPDC049174]
MSRAELAEAVAAWLWDTTQTDCGLDAHYIAKLERGVVRWPRQAYREGLREVLEVESDRELGFVDHAWETYLASTEESDPGRMHRCSSSNDAPTAGGLSSVRCPLGSAPG